MLANNCIYLAGEFILTNNSFEVTNPATQEILAYVGNAEIEHLNHSIIKASQAFKTWSEVTSLDKSIYLNKFAQCLLQNKHVLAKILHQEQGKSLVEAIAEIEYSASFFTWFASNAQNNCGYTIPSPNSNKRIYTIIQPIGVCAAITPFNFPSAMLARKLAPALAAGCAMIIKPAPETPLSALAYGYIADKIDLPKGLISILSANQEQSKILGKHICKDKRIKKLSFTGSTSTGKILMQQSASSLKKLSLELGGNAPFIVTKNANLDLAIENAILSKYRNSGQTCVCANRFFIHKEIINEFVDKLSLAINKIEICPLINQKAVQKVQELVIDAIAKGAKVYKGGNIINQSTFAPTILLDVDESMSIYHQEIFGPVASIIAFDTIDEVISKANNTDFGLAAYIFSDNINEIEYLNKYLEFGMIGANTGAFSSSAFPFGGIKQSGFGKEGSIYGIDEYTIVKAICLQTDNKFKN